MLSLAVQSPSEQADLAQVSPLSSLCQAESHPAPSSSTDSADSALQIRWPCLFILPVTSLESNYRPRGFISNYLRISRVQLADKSQWNVVRVQKPSWMQDVLPAKIATPCFQSSPVSLKSVHCRTINSWFAFATQRQILSASLEYFAVHCVGLESAKKLQLSQITSLWLYWAWASLGQTTGNRGREG